MVGAGVRGSSDGDGPGPLQRFARIVAPDTYDALSSAHLEAVKDGTAGDRLAPCNPEQRTVGRELMRCVALRARHIAHGVSAEDAQRDRAQHGVHSTVLVVGPGGAGKSHLVHHLMEECLATVVKHVLVTAYTGVRANHPLAQRLSNRASAFAINCCPLTPLCCR